MADVRPHIRRARRTDFTAVMALLASAGIAVPPADRATLRRFRNIVADLGADFYVALVDETLAGLVHVTYVRQLTLGPSARVEQLVVAAPFRRQGVGSALLSFARQRARKHGCATLSCVLRADADAAVRALLGKMGGQRFGEWLTERLPADG